MDYRKHLKSNKKLNEGTEDLGMYMYKVLSKNRGKLKVGKWEGDPNHMMGTIEWNHPTIPYQIFLTPFWEDAEGIAVDMNNIETGEYKSGKVLPFVITGNERKDVSNYMKAIQPVFKLFK